MIKKFVFAVLSIALTSVLVISCGSKPASPQEVVKAGPKVIGAEGIEQPDWVNKVPKSADSFYAVGYAKKSNKANSITYAEQDARDQIARWVNVSVKNALTNYSSEGGEGKNIQVLEYSENISKQVADQSLSGVERDEVWVDKEGGVYVLSSFPKANVGKSFDQVAQSFVRNEATAFANFKSEQALAFLEKETSK